MLSGTVWSPVIIAYSFPVPFPGWIGTIIGGLMGVAVAEAAAAAAASCADAAINVGCMGGAR